MANKVIYIGGDVRVRADQIAWINTGKKQAWEDGKSVEHHSLEYMLTGNSIKFEMWFGTDCEQRNKRYLEVVAAMVGVEPNEDKEAER